MSTDAKHTPTPWRVFRDGNKLPEIVADEGPASDEQRRLADMPAGTIAVYPIARLKNPVPANAEFIVRACNNFDGLLAALQSIASYQSPRGTDLGYYVDVATHARKVADEAIAKATGSEATQ